MSSWKDWTPGTRLLVSSCLLFALLYIAARADLADEPAAATAPGATSEWVEIDSTELEDWPLIVPSVEIGCRLDKEPTIGQNEGEYVTVPLFRHQGTAYALVGHGWYALDYARPDSMIAQAQYGPMPTFDLKERADELCRPPS